MTDWEAMARPAIFHIPPYVPGKRSEEVRQELGLTDVIKLASNENPLGPSPKAVVAMEAMAGQVSVYPDAGARELREALAASHAVSADQVIVGNGSDEIIRLAAEALLGPGDEAVICTPTFGEYLYAVRLLGATPVMAESARGQDLEAMLAAVTGRTKVVFVCNPNNPTGTIVTRDEFSAFLDRLPPGILVVHDGAYREYVEDPACPAEIDHVRQGKPILVLRTFSKIYGLAGLRVGYGLGPPGLVSLLCRVKEPFNVNLIAQAAARAALDDTQHVARSLAMNAAGKDQLYAGLSALGLSYRRSQANFVLVELGRDAEEVHQAMQRHGVIVRAAGAFGLPTRIRVTIGTEDQNKRFLAALAAVLGGLTRAGEVAAV